MNFPRFLFARRAACAVTLLCLTLALPGCAVVSIAGTAAGVAATGVGLAVDGAVGAARLTGRAVGAAADAVIPGGE